MRRRVAARAGLRCANGEAPDRAAHAGAQIQIPDEHGDRARLRAARPPFTRFLHPCANL
ncbi:hypothetical protein C7S16_2344 [Burkholderia thailandensis]|uniref:Uncharacterized protein n=1 Tax=Burkholderia thailandensis TaxID=57975 RepID=A0AAW9D5K3_BURTH|nr:hypothetical protein [Burkholderia thailandensis]MDW9257023.1 hypothetical protein [Burkholderia thailandensis]